MKSSLTFNILSFLFRELDHAMLRRLEKRILVDLPILDARKKMIEFHLPELINPDCALEIKTNIDYEYLAEVSYKKSYISTLKFKSVLVQQTDVYFPWQFSVPIYNNKNMDIYIHQTGSQGTLHYYPCSPGA